MKAVNILPALFLAVSLNAGQNETELWNNGVDSYRRGDVTNTLRIMRPLMLDDSYSARSSEVVAKLEFEKGNFEESARAAQIALRKYPNDALRKENFNLAVSKIPAMLRERRIAQSLKLFEGKDPSSILRDGLVKAREIMETSVSVRTNSAEKAIALSDKMSSSAEDIALLCPGLKNVLQNAVTNRQQISTISLRIDNLEKSALDAAKLLSDMDESAFSSIATAESDLNDFFKLSVLPPGAIDEGITCQSNQFMNVKQINSRSWQKEALDYTRAFRAKFPAWAKAYEEQASANTNMPPFTAEAQKEIVSLSHELEKLQLSCVESDLPSEMLSALGIMFKIRSLLPKSGNSGVTSQSGRKGSGSPDQKESKKDGKPEENKDGNDGADDRTDEKNLQENENRAQENETSGKERDESASGEEIDAVLNKAKERNDEYESEKRLRMRKRPLPPNQRDW